MLRDGRYEKSYMHRDWVTHVAVSEDDFVITGSRDGKKLSLGIAGCRDGKRFHVRMAGSRDSEDKQTEGWKRMQKAEMMRTG